MTRLNRLFLLTVFTTAALVVLGQTPVNIRQVGDVKVASPLPVAASITAGTTCPLATPCVVDIGATSVTGGVAKETGGNLATIGTNSTTLAGIVTGNVAAVNVTAITAAATGPATAANSDAVIQSYNTLGSGSVSLATTGSSQVIAGVASNYWYITSCTVSNASLTVSTDVQLQDGSGGTTLWKIPAPAATVATTGGAGSHIVFPTPLKVPTAGNGLFAANVTSDTIQISCGGFRSTISY